MKGLLKFWDKLLYFDSDVRNPVKLESTVAVSIKKRDGFSGESPS